MVGWQDVLKAAVSTTVVPTIRALLNGQLKHVQLGQVRYAIEANVSLWAVAGADMEGLARQVPPSMIEAGRPLYHKALADYGNASNLVFSWLKEDNMPIYSVILNTPGGKEWFDRQVKEACGQLNLEFEVH